MTEIKAEINLIKMANDIACIKQALLGNGEPGLCHRVDELEKTERKLGVIVGFCTVYRGNPLLDGLCENFGVTSEQLDELFIEKGEA